MLGLLCLLIFIVFAGEVEVLILRVLSPAFKLCFLSFLLPRLWRACEFVIKAVIEVQFVHSPAVGQLAFDVDALNFEFADLLKELFELITSVSLDLLLGKPVFSVGAAGAVHGELEIDLA